VAGVLVAMTIPARTRIDTGEFSQRGRRILDVFDAAGPEGENILTNRGQQAAIIELEDTAEAAQAPLQWIERGLQPWVSFVIIPLFAFANAGVELGGELAKAFTSPVTLGVLLGLLIGKPVGITLFAWAATKLRLAALPGGCGWRALHGVSWLGGIGFTMSLFVTGLAFRDPALVMEAKVGIFAASLCAALAGWLLLRREAPCDVPEVPDDDEAAPVVREPAPVYVAPSAPVYAAPAYAAPAYAAPAYTAQAYAAPAVQREVVYPHGRYVLYGDGMRQPWQWVWIPAASAPPPPPPPPR
jgi:NhaA family Na+:H+ antiporter